MKENYLQALWTDTVPAGVPCPHMDPDRIARNVNAALDAVPSERRRHMRQKLRFAAVLAAAVIALAGTALGVAAHWDVLDAWFQGDTAPAEELVDREVRSVSDKYYTLTVESSVSDGRNAYLIVRVDARNEISAAKLWSDDFVNMDTFSIYPVEDTTEPIQDDLDADAASGVGIPSVAGSFTMGEIKEAATDTSRFWNVDLSLPDGRTYSHARARLCYMEKDLTVEVPLTPADSVTVMIGATGEGAPTLYNALGGTLTVDSVTLSPFTCKIEGHRLPGSPEADPVVFFRMADGSLRTASQMMLSTSGGSDGDDGASIYSSWNYRFKEVLDLSTLSGVVVYGMEYPLDGGRPKPASVDEALTPFRLPLMDSVTPERGGYGVPVRALCDGLGASCLWDNHTQTATCTYRGIVLTLTLGSGTALVDGSPVDIDAPAVQDGKLAAMYNIFTDAWDVEFLAAFNADRSARECWVIFP